MSDLEQNPGVKVLVVDEEKLDRWLLCHALRDAGCAVLEAADGFQALSTIEREQPDLVFLDLRMPWLDGYGVLEQLQERRCCCPVVVVSAELDPEAQMRVLRLGAVEFFSKPVSSQQALAVLQRVLCGFSA